MADEVSKDTWPQLAGKWVFQQAPGLVLLSAILFWLSKYAPDILDKSQARYEAFVEKMNTRYDAIGTKHSAASEKFLATIEAERAARTVDAKEVAKSLGENSKVVMELTSELKKTRRVFDGGAGDSKSGGN